jgi:heterodisulfide reductase subunit B
LLEALGAEIAHFSLEDQCCGGAGGFHRASRSEAEGFAEKKLEAMKRETQADFIVVSCITCLMYLDKVQTEVSNGNGGYAYPVFDYSQLLALCMGFPVHEVASIATTPRESITDRFK